MRIKIFIVRLIADVSIVFGELKLLPKTCINKFFYICLKDRLKCGPLFMCRFDLTKSFCWIFNYVICFYVTAITQQHQVTKIAPGLIVAIGVKALSSWSSSFNMTYLPNDVSVVVN